jgi:YgiT-type zinc finger domain-containing protein
MGDLQRIHQLVRDRHYCLSAHAEEEMWADELERPDVEHCILKGRIEKRLTQDGRGTRYRIEGPARWFRHTLYFVADVEAEVCQECGERYYHATTLDAIDQMLASDQVVVKERLQVVVGMPAECA